VERENLRHKEMPHQKQPGEKLKGNPHRLSHTLKKMKDMITTVLLHHFLIINRPKK
jgi:hypothetical protein